MKKQFIFVVLFIVITLFCEISCKCDPCDYDETESPFANSRCVGDFQCTGNRKCSVNYIGIPPRVTVGWCQGESGCPNPPKGCDPEDCDIDEANTNFGPNRCAGDYQCAGKRTCSVNSWGVPPLLDIGYCRGDSGCDSKQTLTFLK